jgi:hypothetical protein
VTEPDGEPTGNEPDPQPSSDPDPLVAGLADHLRGAFVITEPTSTKVADAAVSWLWRQGLRPVGETITVNSAAYGGNSGAPEVFARAVAAELHRLENEKIKRICAELAAERAAEQAEETDTDG